MGGSWRAWRCCRRPASSGATGFGALVGWVVVVGRADREQAFAHYADALSALGDGGVVGDQDQRQPALAPEFFEQVDDFVAGVLIEVAGGLVGQEHRGLLHQGPGDGNPLLLPAGHLAGKMPGPVSESDRIESGVYPAVALGGN